MDFRPDNNADSEGPMTKGYEKNVGKSCQDMQIDRTAPKQNSVSELCRVNDTSTRAKRILSVEECRKIDAESMKKNHRSDLAYIARVPDYDSIFKGDFVGRGDFNINIRLSFHFFTSASIKYLDVETKPIDPTATRFHDSKPSPSMINYNRAVSRPMISLSYRKANLC